MISKLSEFNFFNEWILSWANLHRMHTQIDNLWLIKKNFILQYQLKDEKDDKKNATEDKVTYLRTGRHFEHLLWLFELCK